MFVFVKGRGTCGSGERHVKIWIDFRKSPRFSLISPLSQEREKSRRPVFTMCGEPWGQKVIKCYFSCKSDLLIECCPSANISCIIRVRSSSKIQSNMYIIKGIQRNLKMCLYQQLPFIYKIRLYALFINGENEAAC